ncbi:MAG: HipA domain-containing protein [Clostridia bacterium]|nr:HipA domain-containing protein [Clostridia bacterium]
MNCLCCGKPLEADNHGNGWHDSCIRRFFGTAKMPDFALDTAAFELLARESTNRGYTVPGVQKKLSLHLSRGRNPRLTLVNYPTGYILKPQVEEYEALPEAEQLAMCMAEAVGISVVPHALVKSGENLAYITNRIDRSFERDGVKFLAMEDFCQLDLRLTQDKYRGSYERCAKIVERYSCQKGLDLTELFLRLVFSFIIGNSDMHLKNLSLVETSEGSAEYVLSSAYDLLPVNVILPEDTEQLALALNGKKTNLRKKDFLAFAKACDIGEALAQRMIARLLSMENEFIRMCEDSLLPPQMKARFSDLIEERCRVLEG